MIYLHIGQEKTGSTAIQSFLDYASRTSKLKEKNIIYASFLHKPNSMPFALYAGGEVINNVSRPFFKNKDEYLSFSREIEDRIIAIANAASKECKIIFSSEHFHAQLKTEEQIQRLKFLINKFFPDHCITLILYIREQASLAYSLHSESVKAGFMRLPTPPRPGQIKYFDHVSDHSNIIEMWTNIFGKSDINIKIYEKAALRNNDSVDDFCALIGIDREEILSKKEQSRLRNNTLTLRGRSLIIKTLINKASNGNTPPYNNIINEALVESFEKEQPALDQVLCEIIRERYEVSNEAIRQRFFPERDQLFMENQDKSQNHSSEKDSLNVDCMTWVKLIVVLLHKIERHNSNILQKIKSRKGNNKHKIEQKYL